MTDKPKCNCGQCTYCDHSPCKTYELEDHARPGDMTERERGAWKLYNKVVQLGTMDHWSEWKGQYLAIYDAAEKIFAEKGLITQQLCEERVNKLADDLEEAQRELAGVQRGRGEALAEIAHLRNALADGNDRVKRAERERDSYKQACDGATRSMEAFVCEFGCALASVQNTGESQLDAVKRVVAVAKKAQRERDEARAEVARLKDELAHVHVFLRSGDDLAMGKAEGYREAIAEVWRKWFAANVLSTTNLRPFDDWLRNKKDGK